MCLLLLKHEIAFTQILNTVMNFFILHCCVLIDMVHNNIQRLITECWDVSQIQSTTFSERKIVHDVCDILAERGARLAAAGIVGILKKIGRDGSTTNGSQGPKNSNSKTVIAMDGGLYEHYTQFRSYMQAAIEEMLSETAAKSVVLELSKDGSGIGTALLAASHSQYGTVF